MKWTDVALCETADSNVITQAAKQMRQMTWRESGFMEVRQYLMADGYLTDAEVTHQSAEFKSAFEQWSKDEVEAAFDRLKTMFRNGKLIVWREIMAPADWTPNPNEHPGLHWSWHPDAAEAHWGGDGERWLLQAHVTFDQIDWINTLAQNAAPDYADEKEIVVLSSAHLMLNRHERR